MKQLNIKCLLTCSMILFALVASAQQKNSRDYLRSGNRLYRDSLYMKSEVDYRKALELDSRSARTYYNLGNALLFQQKPKEAMESYEQAVKFETNKMRQAHIYHNMGVILQSQKQFGPAIECYKEALRRNPADDETRYNLALCQYQQKNNPQDEQGGSEDQNGDKQKEQDKEQQENQKQENQKQEQQQQQPQQPNEENMSKENAEQLLKAAMQNEKNTQERLNKSMQRPQQRRLEKQW